MKEKTIAKQAVDIMKYRGEIENQIELAKKLGYNTSSLSQILNEKKPNHKFLRKLYFFTQINEVKDLIQPIIDENNELGRPSANNNIEIINNNRNYGAPATHDGSQKQMYETIIASYKERIEHLEEQNRDLMKQNASLIEMIHKNVN